MNASPILTQIPGDVRKLFTDNRQDYINQSAATKNGVVATFAALPDKPNEPPAFDGSGSALSEPMCGDDFASIERDEHEAEYLEDILNEALKDIKQ